MKVLTPKVLHDIVYRALHIHGALGVSNEMPLAGMWAMLPVMGIADGPTEVHKVTIARQVLKQLPALRGPLAARAPARAAGGGPQDSSPTCWSTRRRAVTDVSNIWENIDEAARTEGLVDIPRSARGWTRRGPAGLGRADGGRAFISGGSSNEIFEIRRGEHRMALRRPPRVVPEGRNETMLREYRVLEALNGTDVPHPEAIAACDDPSVIGAAFYLMGHVDGWSPMSYRRSGRRPSTPTSTPAPGSGSSSSTASPASPASTGGPGPRGVREARRVPRAPGRPVARPPAEEQLPGAARHRGDGGVAARPHPVDLRAGDHPRRLPVRERMFGHGAPARARRDRRLGDDDDRGPAPRPRLGDEQLAPRG